MYRKQFSIGVYSLVISLLCSTRAYSQGIIGQPVEPRHKMPESLVYSEHYGSEVRMNTPRIHSSPDNDGDWVYVYLKVDAKGIWESFRVGQISKLQTLDFWTIWATATCPPIYPGTKLTFPIDAIVGNKREGCEATADEEFCRNSLGKIVEGCKNNGDIVFPLIPVSIAWIYPNTCAKEELLSINNMVAIPSSLLPKETNWSVQSANKWINSGPLKELLNEWHSFFLANEKPSRAEILNFAQLLKKKYQKVLKEVRGGVSAPSH